MAHNYILLTCLFQATISNTKCQYSYCTFLQVPVKYKLLMICKAMQTFFSSLFFPFHFAKRFIRSANGVMEATAAAALLHINAQRKTQEQLLPLYSLIRVNMKSSSTHTWSRCTSCGQKQNKQNKSCKGELCGDTEEELYHLQTGCK